MIKRLKYIFCLLIISLFFIPSTIVNAKESDKHNNYRFVIHDPSIYSYGSDTVVDIYKIADSVDEIDFEVTDDFKDFFGDAPLYDDGGLNENFNEYELSEYIFKSENEKKITPYLTSFYGNEFDLPFGIYLAITHRVGAEEKDYVGWVTYDGVEKLTTKTEDYYNIYWFAPLLFFNNSSDPETLVISLKVGNKPRETKIEITKVDSDNYDLHLSGAKFKLYSTKKIVDNSETITVYVDDIGYVPLYYQGEYTTDKNGIINITPKPDQSPDTLYALVETKAPKGYILDDTPIFFFAGNERDYIWDFGSWMFSESKSRLHYDSNNQNATSGLSFEVDVDRNEIQVTFKNAVGSYPVYLRVSAYTSDGYKLKYDGSDDWFDGGDGYYYSSYALDGGAVLSNWHATIDGEELIDSNGNIIPVASNVAIIYDFTPALYEEGEPYADWNYGYFENEERDVELLQSYKLDNVRFSEIRHFVSDLYAENAYGYYQLTAYNTIDLDNPPIEDDEEIEIPESGGTGIFLYIIPGVSLAWFSLHMLNLNKRKY